MLTKERLRSLFLYHLPKRLHGWGILPWRRLDNLHTIGALVVVVDDATAPKKVLLTERNHPRMWELPNGGVDPRENIERAAVREIKEETGLDVSLIRLVRVEQKTVTGNLVFVFAASVVGGELLTRTNETVDAGWFAVSGLPPTLKERDCNRIQYTFTNWHAQGSAENIHQQRG